MQLSLIQHHFSLRQLNTFGIDAKAQHYLRVNGAEELKAVFADPVLSAMPRLVLGGGSNLLLTRDYDGLVLHMCGAGREIVGGDDKVTLVRASAGENWHRFVLWTIEQGLGGLENLSLIPGTVGAAPIQNIGAYGAEIKDTFHSLTAFDTVTGDVRTLTGPECRFGYRDSIFKHADGAGLIVLDVTFALPKEWQANLRYAELARELDGVDSPDPRLVSDAVIVIRSRKLPDPAVIGNAGSFFKNPVVQSGQCAQLLEQFPTLVHYPQPDGTEKLAAGWMIDQCGWKGRSLGHAGVYEKQALVLVNRGGATGEDVVALARAIQADVQSRFGVQLEPEPVFI